MAPIGRGGFSGSMGYSAVLVEGARSKEPGAESRSEMRAGLGFFSQTLSESYY